MNTNQELKQTRDARETSNPINAKDWGLEYWEEYLEMEEARKLAWRKKK